jgi:hypothetical protein
LLRLQATLAISLGDTYVKIGKYSNAPDWWVRRRYAWKDEEILDRLEEELARVLLGATPYYFNRDPFRLGVTVGTACGLDMLVAFRPNVGQILARSLAPQGIAVQGSPLSGNDAPALDLRMAPAQE